MFKINYRITTNKKNLNDLSEQDINNGGTIEGYFQLVANGKKYGYFKEGLLKNGEEWDQLITSWFKGLLEMLLKIKTGNPYVVVSNIDSYNTWLEFKLLKNKDISISIIHADKKDGSMQVETIPPENIVYPDWANEEVSYDEMHHEIINKVTKYIAEVDKINPRLANGATFVRLKELLRETKNLA